MYGRCFCGKRRTYHGYERRLTQKRRQYMDETPKWHRFHSRASPLTLLKRGNENNVVLGFHPRMYGISVENTVLTKGMDGVFVKNAVHTWMKHQNDVVFVLALHA